MQLDELSDALNANYRDFEKSAELYNAHALQAVMDYGPFNTTTASIILCEAYDRGHSSGYAEVISISFGICEVVDRIIKANK